MALAIQKLAFSVLSNAQYSTPLDSKRVCGNLGLASANLNGLTVKGGEGAGASDEGDAYSDRGKTHGGGGRSN